MPRAALLALLLIPLLAAQTPASDAAAVEITIHVFDQSTTAGIADAKVNLSGGGDSLAALKTNSSGNYVATLHPGKHYFAQVVASGYPTSGGFQGLREFDTGTKPATINIPLMQAATVTGTVLDDVTDKPLADIPVIANKLSWLHGRREVRFTSQRVNTDDAGHFLITRIEPGDLIVTTNPASREATPDGKPPRYPAEVWPGGVGREEALPIPVPPGATVDFGTLRVHARDLPNLEVTVKGDCARQRFSVYLDDEGINFNRTVAELNDVSCDAVARMTGLSPGTYHLAARPSGGVSPMPPQSADSDITIGKDDAKEELIVRRPVRLSGRVVLKNNDAESPVANVQVNVGPWVPGKMMIALPTGLPVNVDSDGRFRTAVYPMPDGHVHASVSNLPPGLFLEALRYNGSETTGADLNVNPSAISQELTIICSSNFASASGKIPNLKEGTASVLLVPWPSGADTPYPGYVFESDTDTYGVFSITKLPPGHYRMLAVPSAERQKLEMPGILRNLLSTAHEDELHTGAASTVNIELTWP